MDAGKGFVNLTVMVGIFFSGLSFGLGHLYIGFGFAIWVALAIAVLFSMKEEQKMMSLSILIVGILIGLMLAPVIDGIEDGSFWNWGDEDEHHERR